MTPSDPLPQSTLGGGREANPMHPVICSCGEGVALRAIVQPTIYHVQDKDWRPYAERIAAEYARLSSEDPND